MAVYKRRHLLPSAAWVAGNIQIPVSGIPALSRIEAFVFRAELVFTTGAGAAAVASTQLPRLCAALDIGPQVHTTGAALDFLAWQMGGTQVALPAGLPAANNEVHRRTVVWTVPFYDLRAAAPFDDCPVGVDFNDRVISFDAAPFAGLGAGTWDTLASITGTLRAEAILLPPADKVGALVQFGYADLTGQAPSISGTALYTDLLVYRESIATISSVQLATAAVQGDGIQHADNVKLEEYTSRWNRLYSVGPRPQLASATVPEGGEMLPEYPAVTAAAAATVTGPFAPIIYPTPHHKKADALQVEQVLSVAFTGTDTSFRVAYRRVLPHTESSLIERLRRMGKPVKGLGEVYSATANGKAISGRRAGLGRYLPAGTK